MKLIVEPRIKWLIILVLIGTASPTLGRIPRKFDMICKVRGHTVVVNKPGRDPVPGRSGQSSWQYDLGYVIDLDRMIYRQTDSVSSETQKIQFLTKTRIYFSKDRQGYEWIDLSTNRYRVWSAGTGYLDEVDTGMCRRARFSGFPAARIRTK